MLAAFTRWSVRRPVLVVVVWLAVVAGSFAVGVGVFDRLVSDVGRVPGSESDRASDLIDQADHEGPDGPRPVTLSAIVYGPPVTDPALVSAVDAAIADVRAMPGVLGVTDPVPSTASGRAFGLRVQVGRGPETDATVHAVSDRLHRIATGTVAVSGGGLTAREFNRQARSDVQKAETLTTPVVLLLLLLVFGGLTAAGLPLLIAVAGVGGTFAILYACSEVTDVSVYSIQVVTMLSVGLAVDYGLLIVSRFREERAVDPDVPGAVTRAMSTAGRTVVYSGLTVAAVLAGLLVFPEPFLRSMGVAGVGVVAFVVAAAVTLLPALLALAGRRIRPARPAPVRGGRFAAIARAVQRRPLLTLLGAAALMLLLAVPVLDLRLAQVDARLLPTGTQTRQVHDATVAHFPELHQPAQIVIAVRAPADDPAVAALRRQILAVPHVTGIGIGNDAGIGTVAGSGSVTVLRANIDVPGHSAGARRAVAAVRALDAPVEVAVTGDTAMLVDYEATIVDHLPYAVTIIGVGTLVLLFLFTGSVLLPVKAVATNVLSIGAALGAVVWVFQQGHLASWFGTTRLDATHVSVPVLVGAIAFGLSVDYEVFLLSRIREHWLATRDNEEAVVRGLQHTGRIITSAALLLAVVFAGFLTAGFVPVQAIGLGLTLAVALDATVVRLLLVPATMTLAGRFNWWAPAPLRRVHTRLGLAEPTHAPAGPAAGAVADDDRRHARMVR